VKKLDIKYKIPI